MYINNMSIYGFLVGTPKSSIPVGLSIINHPFWEYPHFRKPPHTHTHTHIYIYISLYIYIRFTYIQYVYTETIQNTKHTQLFRDSIEV